ncbi:hypothetical protein NPIL_482581 [Nephila pilipes]|uniref:Uncharacterized protein n=1 Tax=Nephila pilipes TaxID=299642 RepID=A0A8X6MYA2_NEPPI|nr:hypothetical protein NPIL_482581 [Nephila pilipes]
MKTLCVFALVLCCVCLAVGQRKTCKTNEDCDEGECCVRMSEFIPSKCRKLQKEFHLCNPNAESHEGDGFYNYMCPCAEGLKCESRNNDEKEGKHYGGGTCRKTQSGSFVACDLRYGRTGAAFYGGHDRDRK